MDLSQVGSAGPAIPAGIDTSAMLTMAGLIAAVWAVVPATARLGFRLSLSWIDWAVIWGLLALIHAFFFEPVLRSLGLYPIIGDWRWGFEKSTLQYTLFLALVTFVYVRSKKTRVSRWKLFLFEELTMALLHARRFDDLAVLLDRHLESVLALAKAGDVRERIARWLAPGLATLVIKHGPAGAIEIAPAPMSRARKWWRQTRNVASRAVMPSRRISTRALGVLTSLLSSRQLAGHLARTRPRLCLRIMERVTLHVASFQDECFIALLEDDSSVLFAELQNSEQLADGRGHRLDLPEENRLLRFYLRDVSVADDLGVYRSVGEAALSRIEVDDVLMARLNGPLLRYQEVGSRRCPIYMSIYFFRLMVLEGLHQRFNDHLWLHYTYHFVDKLLERARQVRPDDANHEFATPLAYLLYCIVDVTCDWVEEAAVLTEKGAAVQADAHEGRHVYISFEATTALGAVLEPILVSDRVTDRLKTELLTVTLRALERVQRHKPLAQLADAMCCNLMSPHGLRNPQYLRALRFHFNRQDHLLRRDMARFEQALGAEESFQD